MKTQDEARMEKTMNFLDALDIIEEGDHLKAYGVNSDFNFPSEFLPTLEKRINAAKRKTTFNYSRCIERDKRHLKFCEWYRAIKSGQVKLINPELGVTYENIKHSFDLDSGGWMKLNEINGFVNFVKLHLR